MRKLNGREKEGRSGDGVVVIIAGKAHKTVPLPFAPKKRNSAGGGLIDCCLTIPDYGPVDPAPKLAVRDHL